MSIVLKNKHTARIAQGDVVIMRPSILGNPFSHMSGTRAQFVVGSRDEAVDRYEPWLRDQYKNNPAVRAELIRLARMAKEGTLTMVCCCAPKRCHGDVIKKAIEGIITKGLV